MKVVVLQPGYIPWSGYFDQMHQADLFVHATNLQFTRQDWRSRNRIKTRNGWQWLTVPVRSKGMYKSPIHEIQVNNDIPWASKHLNLLKENYADSPFYDDYINFFEDAYRHRWEFLVDLDLHIIHFLRNTLKINTEMVDIQELGIDATDKNERLIQVCKKLGATTYISGNAAKAYIRPELFDAAGILLVYHEYQHPVYPQLHGDFVPYMSIVDVLFNCGPQSRSVIAEHERYPGAQNILKNNLTKSRRHGLLHK